MNSVCTLCCDGCKEHGERIERERIIKLLKELNLFGSIDTAFVPELIALIKGEK